MNTRELNNTMAKGLQIIEKFCKRNIAHDEDFNNLYDYLLNESMSYYYKLLNDENNEVNEKTILNCFWHSINVLKLRHGTLNYACNNDGTVYACKTIGGGIDSGEYHRIIKSKYRIDRYNYINYQSIATTYTNRCTRNEVEHGVSHVSIYDSEFLKNTLYSGLTPDDELIKKEQAENVRKVLKPMFNDVNFNKFELIIKSEKTNTDTERKMKNRFKNKYPFLKELEKSDIVYLINTYKA